MPLCSKCGKPIEFIAMSNGKKMPVDAEMIYVRKDPEGPVQIIEVIGMFGHQFNATYAEKGAAGTIKVHQSHWGNCASGITRTAKLSQEEWRKRMDARRPTRKAKPSTHHPHYDPGKKSEPKTKMEQIALF